MVLDSTLDETGVLRTLEHPVQIQWAKTIPRLLYPITYVGVRFAPLSHTHTHVCVCVHS